MKKLLMMCALIGGVVFANAQEKIKDHYVKEGKLIKATLFHDNGEISQKGFYTKEGKLQGDWVSFDNQGNKTAEAHYDNGQKVGKWFFWTEGTLREVDYDQSKITSVGIWKSDGESVVTNN